MLPYVFQVLWLNCFCLISRVSMPKMKPLKQTTVSTLTFVMITKMAAAFVYCPPWEYQPEEGKPCVPCSQCPKNQIVRETCSGTRDTVCGPFTEFKLFPAKGDAMFLNALENHSNIVQNDIAENNDTGAAEAGSWQTVTIVMICVLSVTGVLFIILVAITWHLCRRQNKEALLSSADPGMYNLQILISCSLLCFFFFNQTFGLAAQLR